MTVDKKIILRNFKVEDIDDYYDLMHPSREYHKFNGPYYKKANEEELREYLEKMRKKLTNNDNSIHEKKKIIADKNTDEIIGEVSWYWKSEETFWMEIGIVVFNENYWGKGIGYQALPIWIDELFDRYKKIVRLGLTTWSGNKRMMKLAQKIGFKCEAVYRNARIVKGKYYDSVSYGVLREEWNKIGKLCKVR
ncbi:GNAT family protein [Clostridiaceae bacterium M8S5]|nr:GNAT family protein [Clostridiaceae bacterium M8S5]